ncbi:MAG: methyl-accepting chemotaxis protein [Desulfobulbaceae bacterium]|nr:methyl-accepting chemotaxis protein [Desulfobulbaceae bacterium]
MGSKKLGIGAKLYLSFGGVMMVFVCVCLYQIMGMNRLGGLQDEGAGRNEDALKVERIGKRMAASYSVMADALINRNMDDTSVNFAALQKEAEGDIAVVRGLADTDAEKALAEEFASAYAQYLKIFADESLPILQKEESLAKRYQDALTISEISKRLLDVYSVIADSIINRNFAQTRKEFAVVKEHAEADIATIHKLADTGEERQWADEFDKDYEGYLALFEKELLPKLVNGSASAGVISKYDERLDKLRGKAEEMLKKISDSLHAESVEVAANEKHLRQVDGQVDVLRDKAEAPLGKIIASLGDESREADEVFDSIRTQTIWLAICISVVAIVAGLAIAFIITRSLLRQLGAEPEEVAGIAQRIAAGDLAISLDHDRVATGVFDAMRKMVVSLRGRADLVTAVAAGDLTGEVELASDEDQFGRALRTMGDGLNEMLGQVQQAVDQIATGSGQVSAASQSLSQGATEQASSLEEITSSMTEVGSQTKLNAENATQANQLAVQARTAAEGGNTKMQDMVSAMGEINEAGQNISKIIKVIDEIAFQTNLLALNAAVEAARAGRHGKGFAVVAEEVRNLAARSAKAAKETAELIEGSVEKTRNGSEIAESTSEALAEIVNSVTKVTDLVGEIAASSNEQAQGIGQTNQALSQIDQVTQQNTASAEECAATSEELAAQAAHLNELVARFQLRNVGAIGVSQQALPGPASVSIMEA